MAQFYDAAVIGGGPAGSTVATALARAGRSVIVFEKEKFPRFHVGESLLPFCLPIFEKLGLSEKIRAAGFQEKYGAFFWNAATGGTRRSSSRIPGRPPSDGLPGQARGFRPAAACAIASSRGRSCGRRRRFARSSSKAAARSESWPAAGPAATKRSARASSWMLPARRRFFPDKLGTRRFDAKLKRAAVFAHYEGVPRPPGKQAGDILLPTEEGVWYWIIPFSDGTSSVGAVFDPSVVGAAEGETLERRFERLIARSGRMPELLGAGRRTSKVYGISDYSAASATLRGDGYVLVGDAATFLDPVFSTGVFLALATGMRAAAAVDGALAKHGRVDSKDLKTLRERSQQALRPVPALRVRLLRSGLLRGLLHRSPERVDARRRHERARRRSRAGPVPSAGLDEPDVLGIGFDRWRRRLLRLPPNGPKAAEAQTLS